MVTIELAGGPAAVGAARHAIDELADHEQLPRVDDLRLLVSELVTNSVLHGGMGPGDSVHLHVDTDVAKLLVEVGGQQHLDLLAGSGSTVRLGFDQITIVPRVGA